MLRKLCISVALNGIYSDRPQEPDLCTSTIERKQYLFERTYVKKCSLCMLLLLNRSFHGFSTFYKEKLAKKKPSTQLESKVAKFEKRFVENERKWSSPKSRNCTDVCMVTGTNLSPTIQTSRLFGSITSLSLDVPPLNFVSCRWIFAYCSL